MQIPIWVQLLNLYIDYSVVESVLHDKMYFIFIVFCQQGISPKIEFVTVTNIKESLSPELDALEDELEAERVGHSVWL